MRGYTRLAITLALFACHSALEAAPAPAWQGSYSNVCVHPGSGDLLGVELSFIPHAGGTAVVWQRFEGEGLAPQVLLLREQDGRTVAAASASAAAMFTLVRERTRLRLHYLDGQQDDPAALRPARLLWMGARAPVCRG